MSTVESDFLASNTYLGDPKAVEVSWLRAGFAEMLHIYGSFDAYLHRGLMLTDADIAAIKSRMLV
jgi:protein-tyrosine phosphatase